MIGIVGRKRSDRRSSFHDLVAYIKDKTPARVMCSGSRNIIYPECAALEMESVSIQNTRCKDPVMHLMLSWRENEIPSDEQVKEAVDIALKEMKLEECQVLWTLHGDTQNAHVHIAVNRIHPETFKAIDAADGYTINAIHRAARMTELAQGWEVEQNGTYFVSQKGEIIRKKTLKKEGISKSAGDMEAHTGQKSAERTAKEVAADIIRGATSWEDLHKRLAEVNIALEKKGSGAVLLIGESLVKLSTAGRDISLSKLVSRLGMYEARDAHIKICKRMPEPIEKVETHNVKAEWERYHCERTKYFESKDSLAVKHKEEYKKLIAAQKKERQRLFQSTSWKGRGRELNTQRSMLASHQAGQKLDLRDRQNKERIRYHNKFPSFKKWLDENEKSQKPSINYRYSDNASAWSNFNNSAPDKEPINGDIRDFWVKTTHLGRVIYTNSDERTAQFIDNGKKIVIYNSKSDEVVLAALQLSLQKWGGVHIDGDDDYIDRCLRIAKANNIQISNIEKVNHNEREGVEKMSNKRQVFDMYADAVGAERYRVLVTNFSENGTSAFVFDKKNGGYDGKTRGEIRDALPRFSAYTHFNNNINVFPLSQGIHHLVIDDLSEDTLQKLKDDGYKPACIIESSPGNYQAILNVPSLIGDTGPEREAANKLVKELNSKYGDANFSGAVHAHRLPPFPNFKPKHRRENGTFPETELKEANGGNCDKAKNRLVSITQELAKMAEKATNVTQERAVQAQCSANDPNRAYWAHARDIISRQGVSDFSRLDGMIGIRMKVTGYSQSQIAGAIESNGAALRRENLSPETYSEKYKNRDWQKYATETANNFVFGSRGHKQFLEAKDFAPYLLKVEGRNFHGERGSIKTGKTETIDRDEGR